MRSRASVALVVTGIGVAALFALPGAYVAWRTAGLGAELSAAWSDALGPLRRSIELAGLVAASTTVLGTALAWLLVRTDVPGRRFFSLLVPLPLALPSFVGAAAFITAISPAGLLGDAARAVGLDGVRSFRGLGPAWLVLTLFTYPYVYLPVAARLASMPTSAEESALLLGASERRVLTRVVLPQLRPAMGAGALLGFLYAISDFGAVQLLGHDTLTRVIFATRLSDRALSFTAASLVIVLAVAAALASRRMARPMGGVEAGGARAGRTVRLGRWRWPAAAGIVGLGAASLGLPISSLGLWAWRGVQQDRVSFGDLVDPSISTVGVSVAAAVAGMLVVLPVALLTTRHRSRVGGPVAIVVLAGFAVPGLVVALSLVFWSLSTSWLVALYQTFPLLVLTYVLHFGSQALGGAEVAVAAVPRSLRESAALLGVGRVRRVLRVDLPLMRGGLRAGGGLVLLSTFKELPATLLLAPIGFSTLATTVWSAYDRGSYADVGAASLVLVAVAGGLTHLLIVKRAPRPGRPHAVPRGGPVEGPRYDPIATPPLERAHVHV